MESVEASRRILRRGGHAIGGTVVQIQRFRQCQTALEGDDQPDCANNTETDDHGAPTLASREERSPELDPLQQPCEKNADPLQQPCEKNADPLQQPPGAIIGEKNADPLQ